MLIAHTHCSSSQDSDRFLPLAGTQSDILGITYPRWKAWQPRILKMSSRYTYTSWASMAYLDWLSDYQCCIPCFKGLLDEPHNRRLMKLLYRTAEWHGLAKLRLHTESSLTLLESLTTEFGLLIQNFQELTCSQFATTELPCEEATRKPHDLNTGVVGPSQSGGAAILDRTIGCAENITASTATTSSDRKYRTHLSVFKNRYKFLS